MCVCVCVREGERAGVGLEEREKRGSDTHRGSALGL